MDDSFSFNKRMRKYCELRQILVKESWGEIVCKSYPGVVFCSVEVSKGTFCCIISDWPADGNSCSGRRHKIVLVFSSILIYIFLEVACAHRISWLVFMKVEEEENSKKRKWKLKRVDIYKVFNIFIFGIFAPGKSENQVSLH